MKYNERGKSRIEVSDILNYFKDIDSYYNDCTRYDTLKRMLEDIVAETKEDAERKTGRWILVKGSNGKNYHKCSECLHTQEITGVKNYCAVCGAEIREPEDIPMEYFENGGR